MASNFSESNIPGQPPEDKRPQDLNDDKCGKLTLPVLQSTTETHKQNIGSRSMITRSMSKKLLSDIQPQDSVSQIERHKRESASGARRKTSNISSRSLEATSSVKERQAILTVRAKAQRELDELEIQQTKLRLDLEEQEYKRKQQIEEEDFRRQRAREEMELFYKQKMRHLHIKAEMEETRAQLEVAESKPRIASLEDGQKLPGDENICLSKYIPSTKFPEIKREANPLITEPTNLFPIYHDSFPPPQNTSSTHLRQLFLPTQEPPTFDGNPGEYRNFVDAFDTLIASQVYDPKHKLFFLLKYTTDAAHTLIEGCRHFPSSEGYAKARSMLQQTFGQKFQIARVCTDKVTMGPRLYESDKHSLIKFSANLTSCMLTLSGMNYLHRMDNMFVIMQIKNRLPDSWKAGWDQVADKILHEEDREVSLKDLSKYVADKTRAATNFMYVTPYSSRPVEVRSRASAQRGISFVTQVEESTFHRKCKLCSNNHFLNQCKQFRNKTYEDRKKFVIDNKLCFSCLAHGHHAKSCSREHPCVKPGCDGTHTTLLHPPSYVIHLKPDVRDSLNDTNPEIVAHSGFVDAEQKVARCQVRNNLLPVLPVKVRIVGSPKYIVTRALLDTGSTASFISEHLMHLLGVTGPRINLCTTTINKRPDSKIVQVIDNLEISDLNESELVQLNPLFSNDRIPVAGDEVPTQYDIDQFTEFQDIVIPMVDCGVDLLIGNDNSKVLQPQNIIKGEEGRYAIQTRVGWIVSCPGKGLQTNKLKNFFTKTKPHPMCQMCTDVIDSLNNEKEEISVEQQLFMNKLRSSVTYKNGHYEIPLPMKCDEVQLPCNLPQAEQRAQYLKRRFERDPDYFNDYNNFMQNMINKGYAEVAPKHDLPEGKIWYIPHHGVYHPDKPGKIRIVFDCAARFKGTSLNDNLLPGPDLTNTLFGVLCRFRRENIAIMGDIEAMFHQVGVPESDRDLLRFLWWEDGNLDNMPKHYRMSVYPFGTVCSPSCANFALIKTAEDNRAEFDKSIIESILSEFYVDDNLSSRPDAKLALTLALGLCEILLKGGFRITKWLSNSREVLESIPITERASGVTNLDLNCDALPVERALGLIWDVENDMLAFRTNPKTKPFTRRGILSVVNSIYDPLGFGAAVIQPMKVLMQNLCKLELGWDDPIPESCHLKWSNWIQNVSKLSKFHIPRCYKPLNFGEVKTAQLHHFSDASEESYGSVSYIRMTNDNNDVHCALLLGKTRLIPLKRMTIPRLELSAATISARSDKSLKRELNIPIQKSVFWTDSVTVLRYLHNTTKPLQTFVANRVAIIKECSDVNQWKYVPTKQNPADDASRGLSIDNFLKSHRWVNGPDFLWKQESKWPAQPEFIEAIPDLDPEVKSSNKHCFTCAHEPSFMDVLIERYSSWTKLKKILAWIIRYTVCLKSRRGKIKSVHKQSQSFKTVDPISVEEMQIAENLLYKHLQNKFFLPEIEALSNDKSVKQSSSLVKLDPILKNGLLRVGGRLHKAPIQYQSKHQIILPRDSFATKLLVEHIHQEIGHFGREHVLATLREKVWIPKASSLVRKVLSECLNCRKLQSSPGVQKMAELPNSRLQPDKPPFSFVGLDCFGPFFIRQRRSNVKRYGVVFTCMTTRAIHIEVIHSMDTSSFVNALRRFLSRRGPVLELNSDNGSNFVGSERELREALEDWNQFQIHEFLLQKNIKWNFTPPGGSHHGGVWERQIKSIRKVLSALCHEQILNDESLTTLMCEVEAIVNSRPLTTVSDDPRDLEPITPNHLLKMKCNNPLPPGLFNKNDIYSRRRWKQVQYLADIFWKRWLKEYMAHLQLRQKWFKGYRNFQRGDIVLLADFNAPRNTWMLGRILKTFPDAKGFVRKVRILTKNSVLERPITKICLLNGSDE